MRVGDVVWIEAVNDATKNGVGVYLGMSHRCGKDVPTHASYRAFLWQGRVATFIPRYWKFKVLT